MSGCGGTGAGDGGVAGTRSALIVASDAYTDPGLRRLRAPAADAGALAAVLQDPDIGGFEVRTLLNEPAHEITLAVEEFFADRRPDDLLLLHFSCHGLKDETGELHFAAVNTKLRRLGATAVAAEFVNRRMSRSRSRRVVLLLDCCYAGAFERGMTARAGTGMGIEEQFGGRGRAVITASTAMEYALEGDEVADMSEPSPSVFTSALVQGLQSGDADRDQDGLVALDELYDYIYDRVRASTPNQTPSKWVFGVQGDLYIARRSRPVTTPAPLPPELQDAIQSPFAGVRAATVPELASMAQSRHAGLALAARLALEGLSEDDSRTVSSAATSALGSNAPPVPVKHEAPAGEREPPMPVERVGLDPGADESSERPRRPTGVSPPAARPDRGLQVAGQLALAGAVLLVLGLLAPYQWGEALGIRQPEAPGHVLVLAAGVFGAAVAVLVPRTRRLIGPGLLLGVVAASTAGLVNLFSSWIMEDGFNIGFGIELAAYSIFMAAAGLTVLSLARGGAVRLVLQRPEHPLWWLVVLLGVTSALVLAVHTNRLWDDGWQWWIAPYIWITAIALLLPLCGTAIVPRQLGTAILLGWAAGGVILSSFQYAVLQRVRNTVGTQVDDALVVVFGLTMIALLSLGAVLVRATSSTSSA